MKADRERAATFPWLGYVVRESVAITMEGTGFTARDVRPDGGFMAVVTRRWWLLTAMALLPLMALACDDDGDTDAGDLNLPDSFDSALDEIDRELDELNDDDDRGDARLHDLREKIRDKRDELGRKFDEAKDTTADRAPQILDEIEDVLKELRDLLEELRRELT
ncbi:MAG: hypothetical protein ACR2HN_03415 [Tepidiformaceae bacterium]